MAWTPERFLPSAISGEWMERLWSQRAQPVASGTRSETAQMSQSPSGATHGNGSGAHGKEGVDGSSPSEGSSYAVASSRLPVLGRRARPAVRVRSLAVLRPAHRVRTQESRGLVHAIGVAPSLCSGRSGSDDSTLAQPRVSFSARSCTGDEARPRDGKLDERCVRRGRLGRCHLDAKNVTRTPVISAHRRGRKQHERNHFREGST